MHEMTEDRELVNILLKKGDNGREIKSLLTYSSKIETRTDRKRACLQTPKQGRQSRTYKEFVNRLLSKGDNSRLVY